MRSFLVSNRRRIACMFGLLFGLLCASPFLAGAYIVPTVSMQDTLQPGDQLIVSRGLLTSLLLPRLRHNDIVAFRVPNGTSGIFLKRIVGLPADRIRISNKALLVNGKPVQEPWAVHKTAFIDDKRDNSPEILVPTGHYFVLGDNRDNSLDSRYFGLVPEHEIVGKALFVYWPAPMRRVR